MLTTVCASDYDDMPLAELMKRGLLGPNVENTGQARVDPLAVTRGRLQPRMQSQASCCAKQEKVTVQGNMGQQPASMLKQPPVEESNLIGNTNCMAITAARR